jgi:hypothetical protein
MYGFSTLTPYKSMIVDRVLKSSSDRKILSTSSSSGAKWDARTSHDPHHTNNFYGLCMVGGMMSCGLTHLAVTPLDVAKCNMQVDPVKYKGLVGTIKTIMAEEGSGALFKGWFPTLIGYSAQGMFKFGLYEFFKDYYSNLAGEENAHTYRGLIFLAGSASAEFFADMALCPMEMIKVKVQTSTPGTFPTGTLEVKMAFSVGHHWLQLIDYLAFNECFCQYRAVSNVESIASFFKSIVFPFVSLTFILIESSNQSHLLSTPSRPSP